MSKMMSRCLALVVVGLSTLIVSSLPAQDDPAASSPAARASGAARRVPRYFGQVGLTPQQREKIYEIRGKYQTKIADLKRQIEESTAREMAECEAVLTDAQRKLLDQLRPARKGRTTPANPGNQGNP